MSLHPIRKGVLIQIDFDPEFLGDILVTAFDGHYGGCWYWVKPDETKETWLETDTVEHDGGMYRDAWSKVYLKGLVETTGVAHLDALMEEGKFVSQQDIADACAKVLQEGSGIPGMHQAIMEQEAGDIDADGADYLVQMALFGEVVFG